MLDWRGSTATRLFRSELGVPLGHRAKPAPAAPDRAVVILAERDGEPAAAPGPADGTRLLVQLPADVETPGA